MVEKLLQSKYLKMEESAIGLAFITYMGGQVVIILSP
jgi:hypothetical protein